MTEDIHDPSQVPLAETAQDKPLNWLGKLLVLVTTLLTFGAAFPITLWITGKLEWGIYPRVMLVVPIVAVGFGFWVAVYKLCELLGIPLEQER